MADLAPWVQLGMFGLTLAAITGLLRKNWAPGWYIEQQDARIKELEAEVLKWQDRTFEALRATKTVAGVASEVIRSQRDVAT